MQPIVPQTTRAAQQPDIEQIVAPAMEPAQPAAQSAAQPAPQPQPQPQQPQPQAALAAESTGGADTATSGAGAAAPSHATSMSVAEQVETLKKLKELVDIGILSQEEFDMKKHEVLGL